ncbi:MAG: hypothetical protein LBQ54_14570 [Planctomycetaceae bacterium]|jgi:hypothetical protein|nr:hypothetical protein [Planctomycetaceae bacterium]
MQKTLTKEELAAHLSGIEYRDSIPKELLDGSAAREACCFTAVTSSSLRSIRLPMETFFHSRTPATKKRFQLETEGKCGVACYATERN